jgi:hypothetical protein
MHCKFISLNELWGSEMKNLSLHPSSISAPEPLKEVNAKTNISTKGECSQPWPNEDRGIWCCGGGIYENDTTGYGQNSSGAESW